jgi:hypothetical protein
MFGGFFLVPSLETLRLAGLQKLGVKGWDLQLSRYWMAKCPFDAVLYPGTIGEITRDKKVRCK